MKKLILSILCLVGSALHGQNPTLVYTTNGFANYPATTHSGKVTVGPSTNGIAPGITNFFGYSVGGGYKFYPGSSGSATPGGSSGDIQFNNGGALGGSNAFRINFSGLNARVSNAVGGMIEFVAPTTNINFYARRAVFGPTNTVPPDQYTDYYFKGQRSDFPAFIFDSTTTSKGRFMVQHYEASQGGFDFFLGRPSGNPAWEVFMDVNATSPVLQRTVGAQDFQFGVINGSQLVFGEANGNVLVAEYASMTNDAIRLRKQVILPQQTLTYPGTTNIVWNVTNAPNAFLVLTNYARLIPTNYYAGGSYQITVLCNANGAGLSFDSRVLFAGGTVPTITTNGLDILNFSALSTNATSTNFVGTALQNLR